MADLKKRQSMAEKAEARKANTHIENRTVDSIAKKPGMKDKSIAVRVNSDTYVRFKRICRERGLTANGCINMLICDFVRENKNILEE